MGSATIPFCCRRLDTSGFRLRPSLHLNSLHLPDSSIHNPPLINSIYDIAKSTDIHLLVKRAGTMDTILSVNSFVANHSY